MIKSKVNQKLAQLYYKHFVFGSMKESRRECRLRKSQVLFVGILE